MTIADLIAYLIVFCGCLHFGRRLYGGWVPAIFLGLVSPIAFGLVAGFLVAAQLSVVDVVRAAGGLPRVNADNAAILGTCMIISAIVTVGGLWMIAQKEGTRRTSADRPAEK